MERFPLIYDAKHCKVGAGCKPLFCKRYFHESIVKHKESPHLGWVLFTKNEKKTVMFYNLQEFSPISVINNPEMAFAFL